jgi:hypothetical protein
LCWKDGFIPAGTYGAAVVAIAVTSARITVRKWVTGSVLAGRAAGTVLTCSGIWIAFLAVAAACSPAVRARSNAIPCLAGLAVRRAAVTVPAVTAVAGLAVTAAGVAAELGAQDRHAVAILAGLGAVAVPAATGVADLAVTAADVAAAEFSARDRHAVAILAGLGAVAAPARSGTRCVVASLAVIAADVMTAELVARVRHAVAILAGLGAVAVPAGPVDQVTGLAVTAAHPPAVRTSDADSVLAGLAARGTAVAVPAAAVAAGLAWQAAEVRPAALLGLTATAEGVAQAGRAAVVSADGQPRGTCAISIDACLSVYAGVAAVGAVNVCAEWLAGARAVSFTRWACARSMDAYHAVCAGVAAGSAVNVCAERLAGTLAAVLIGDVALLVGASAAAMKGIGLYADAMVSFVQNEKAALLADAADVIARTARSVVLSVDPITITKTAGLCECVARDAAVRQPTMPRITSCVRADATTAVLAKIA